jgi:hypothetical protein
LALPRWLSKNWQISSLVYCQTSLFFLLFRFSSGYLIYAYPRRHPQFSEPEPNDDSEADLEIRT